jgi:hypothetical protein
MNIGPFTLTHERPAAVIKTLHHLLTVDLPWGLVDGLRIQCRDDVTGARYWPPLHMVVMSTVEVMGVPLEYLVAHEVGHAVDVKTLSDRHRAEVHAILHDGTADTHPWFLSGRDMHHWESSAEAFADYIAWYCGQTVQTAYGYHSWAGRADAIDSVIRRAAVRFADVTFDHPHRDGIERLVATGAMAGYPDGTFRPSATATRGQVCTTLMKVA